MPTVGPVRRAAASARETNPQLISTAAHSASCQQLSPVLPCRISACLEAEPIYETSSSVIEYKVSRESNLETETYTTTKVPAEFLEATLQQYRSELIEVPGISPRVAESLAHEAVADWLLRCPMDFDE